MKFLAGSEKRFFEFVSGLNDKDKIALICHNDLDGVASAIVVSEVIGNIEHLDFIEYSSDMTEKLAVEVKKRKINKIIFCDISIKEDIKKIEELKQVTDIVVLDHHRFEKDLNSDKIVYIKTETNSPACYLCYYLFSKIANIKNKELIVALGIVSEISYYQNKEFVDSVAEKYDMKMSEDINESEIWNITQDITLALIYLSGKTKQAYDILADFSLDKLGEIKKYSSQVYDEIERIKEDFNKNREVYSWGYYYKFSSRFAVKSMIITGLSMTEKESVFVFAFLKNNRMSISFRNQNRKTDCYKLALESVKGLEDTSAGGHIPAAGAEIKAEDELKFKENLIRVLGK
ncbi:DHH family phosphoesterase [Candidatus Pacearchaeota archaeon]|nr:DHH family phosphoesterase [Candidatus Pacearchaeota archaeon]